MSILGAGAEIACNVGRRLSGPSSTCCETKSSAADAVSPARARDWSRSRESKCRAAPPWRIRSRCRKNDCPPARPCPKARTRLPFSSARRFARSIPRTETPPADSGTTSTCNCATASNRCRNKLPSHLRRDCPAARSRRRAAPLKTDRARSKTRRRNKAGLCDRKCRRGHLHSSDTRATVRDRAENNSRHRRSRCNPPAPFPRRAPPDTAPKNATALPGLFSARRCCSAFMLTQSSAAVAKDSS